MQEIRHAGQFPGQLLSGLSILFVLALTLHVEPVSASPARPPSPVSDSDSAEGDVVVIPLRAPLGPLAYTPGRGLRVGDTSLTVGGYSSANLSRDEGKPAQLQWDRLSFFVIADPAPRLHLFSEFELEDLLQVDDHGRGGTSGNSFSVERLHADAAVSDEINLRVGKFLTPVGRWNLIHAQPLVWTTSRPLATLLPFDVYTTGATVFGSLFPTTGNVSYALFGQFVNQLDRIPQPQQADRSGGARLEYATHSGLAVGASYLAFVRRGDWQHLIGLDSFWRHDVLEVMAEFVFEDGARDREAQWGLYLQSVLELTSRLYLVARYEHFDQRVPEPEVNLVDLGLAYKPWSPVILKAEYLIADHRASESPPGFRCSLAVLF